MQQVPYGGYVIAALYKGETYHIKVAEGFRGMSVIFVSAEMIDGVWHISHEGRPFTVVEVTGPVPDDEATGLFLNPSDIVKPLNDTVWQNAEKETVASNICKLARFKNDDWDSFTWEDYVSFCSHHVTPSDQAVLDGFVETGYLEKDEVGTYSFTHKIIGVYLKYS